MRISLESIAEVTTIATVRPPGSPAPHEPTPEQTAATMRSKPYLALLIMVAVIGVVVSFVTWGFLELLYLGTQELYTHLPNAVGYHHGPPLWWSLPILAVAGLIVALAISRLPGNGGHVPVMGLSSGKATTPIELPGIVLAGLVGVSSGIVLGPEAPLLALGPGLAVVIARLLRRDMPPQALALVGAAGAFAAVSFLFVSPVIAAVLMIEVTMLGGARQRLVLIPGLLAAGIGSLLAIGLGSWTGLNRSKIALGPVQVPHFGHPTVAQFGWTIVLALAIAVGAQLIMRGGFLTHKFTAPRPLVLLPIIGLVVAGLAIAFSEAAGKGVNEALFSGEAALPGLVAKAGTWSVSALALLLVFKGLAYGLSLGSFRGGPTFPAIFLGAAAGLIASHLPGFALTPAVAVGIGAAIAAVVRLPLSAVIFASFLTLPGGTGDEPLIIVGVVVSLLVTLGVSAALEGDQAVTEASGRAEPGKARAAATR